MNVTRIVFISGFFCALAFGASHHLEEERGEAPAKEAPKKALIDCALPKNPPPLKIVSLDGPSRADNEKYFMSILKEKIQTGDVAISVEDSKRRKSDEVVKDLFKGKAGPKAELYVHDDGLIEGLYRAAVSFPQNVVVDPKEAALDNLLHHDYWAEAWESLKKRRPLKGAEALAKNLDALAAQRLAPDGWRKALASLGKETKAQWDEVIAAWGNEYGLMVEAKYRGPRGLPDTKLFFDLIKDGKNLDKQKAFMTGYVEDVAIKRNLEKIGEVYCAAVKKGTAREVWFVTNPVFHHGLRTQAQALAADKGIPFRFRQFGSEFEIQDGKEVDVTPFGEPPKP